MEPQLADEIRKAINGNYALGNERFQKEIEKMLNRRVVPGKSGRPKENRFMIGNRGPSPIVRPPLFLFASNRCPLCNPYHIGLE
jgi:hypothetical protein